MVIDEVLLEELEKQLPVTESQVVEEIDLITKPKEMQKQDYQQKVMGNIEPAKGKVRGRAAKVISKDQQNP